MIGAASGFWPTLGGSLLLLLLAGVAGYLLLRVALRARETRELAAAAERIARGDFATALPATGGRSTGQLGRALDSLRHKLAGAASDLQQRQAEAGAILEAVVEGVFTVDRQRRVQFINPQLARMIGIEPAAAVGRFCGDLLAPVGAGGVRPCADQCPIIHARFRGGARATEHITVGGGGRRTVVITSAPMAGDMQVQVVRDESDLEAGRRTRDAILANISHEFKTPLSAQLVSIELMAEQLGRLDEGQLRQLVSSLQRGTLRLTQLIDNLLESVKIEGGEEGIRRRPIALDEVVEQALELTRPLLEQRRQEIELDLPYPMPPLVGDGPRLVQVFVNLLDNASKFAPEGTPVSIGGSVDPREMALWVEDRGPGLPADAGGALFGRFFRAPGVEPDQGGVGLGLAIVHSIVERHGGRLEARSTGTGTRMTVILPLEGGG